jgi:hypothetical protein
VAEFVAYDILFRVLSYPIPFCSARPFRGSMFLNIELFYTLLPVGCLAALSPCQVNSHHIWKDRTIINDSYVMKLAAIDSQVCNAPPKFVAATSRPGRVLLHSVGLQFSSTLLPFLLSLPPTKAV